MAELPTPATGDQDPHLAWAFHATRLLAERELVDDDDAARDAFTDQIGQLWDLIGSTPARTLAGVLAQLECLNDQLATGGCSGEQKRERVALAHAAASLVSLGAAT